MLRLHLSSYELDLDLICISCQPVPICPATLAQSGNLCQWHGPPPSHRLQFAHTTCESHQHGTGSSLATRAISVILKIHIDPRCATFITCCSHLHHAGLCAPSWFGFHEPLLALQDYQDSDVLKTCPLRVLSAVHAPTHYEMVG